MRLHPLKSSQCNRGILDHWPHPREPQRREYPRPTPTHERLLAKLCPMRSTLTAQQTDRLTWVEVKGLCQ